jgi:putative nucleotidyltransferase with HDIG domain
MDTLTTPRQATNMEIPWALRDLPAYRPVARKLMMLADRADAPLGSIEQVLRTDAAFTVDVLRLANSPLFGSRGQIVSVMQAVMMLGLERVKALATTLALRAFLVSSVPGGPLHHCWTHNLATGIVSEWLARVLHLDRDACYTAGLLHDIGRLALLRGYPEKYGRMLRRELDDDFDLLLAEKAVFDIDHCEAGRWILEKWGFPDALLDVASLHHGRPGPGGPELVRVVYVAWQIADLLGFSALNRPVAAEAGEIAEVLPAKARQQVLAEFGALAENVALKVNAIECSLL